MSARLCGSFTVALLAFLLASCATSETSAASTSAVDSAGVRITTIATAPSAIPEWTVAPKAIVTLTGTETGDSAAFALVGSVRLLRDGRIVVADVEASRLLVFDSTGKYLRALGRKGNGPGEFRYVGPVMVFAGDSLAVFERGLQRLSIWQADKGFVRTLQIGDGALETWLDDAWIWRDTFVVARRVSITPIGAVPKAAGIRRWPMTAKLTLHDRSGRLLRTSPDFDGMYTGILERGGDTRLPFSNQPFTALGRDRVYFGSGAKFSLLYVNADFNWAGEVRWPAQAELLTSQEVEELRAETQAAASTKAPAERIKQALAESLAPEILPKDRPAIGRVLVAPDETIWVERFEAVRLGGQLQKAGDRWTILTSEGRSVACLALPSGSRLEAVHGTRVVLVLRDSLDVQTVTVRELVKR